MAYKTFSQKSARFFEIVCYILLVPALISIFLSLAQGGALVFIPLVITGLGLILLSGYRRHARGTFDKDKLSLLWLGTLFFNAIPLTPFFYQIIFNPNKVKRLALEDFYNIPVLLFTLLILWWITAVSFSIALILEELRRDVRIK